MENLISSHLEHLENFLNIKQIAEKNDLFYSLDYAHQKTMLVDARGQLIPCQ